MSEQKPIWKRVPPEAENEGEYHVVVEIPRGGKLKYEYSKQHDVLFLDRVLYSSVHYPESYGFVPGTLSDDGDPMDVLVFCQEVLDPLTVVEAKPIGGLIMEDEMGVDHKILAVAGRDPQYNQYGSFRELPEHRTSEIRQFFAEYKQLEQKYVNVENFFGPDRAQTLIEESIDHFRGKFGGET